MLDVEKLEMERKGEHTCEASRGVSYHAKNTIRQYDKREQ